MAASIEAAHIPLRIEKHARARLIGRIGKQNILEVARELAAGDTLAPLEDAREHAGYDRDVLSSARTNRLNHSDPLQSLVSTCAAPSGQRPNLALARPLWRACGRQNTARQS
jgi:hypothetical protein